MFSTNWVVTTDQIIPDIKYQVKQNAQCKHTNSTQYLFVHVR